MNTILRDVGLEFTDNGFLVDGARSGEPPGHTHFYRLETAARLVGIHPQSLQRIWRNSGDTDTARVGVKFGRVLFFTPSDLDELGYTADEECDCGEVSR